jgi:YVTN family beta-propeller protein
MTLNPRSPRYPEPAVRPASSPRMLSYALAATALIPLGALVVGKAGAQERDGFVYTANEYGASVSAIDLRSGDVTTAPIPISPHNIQITADGMRLLAVGTSAEEGHGHEEEQAGHDTAEGERAAEGLLVVLDANKLDAEPIARIAIGDHPAHVVVDAGGERAFVTDAGANLVAVVDLATKAVIQRIETGRYPHGLRISPDGAEAYVAAVEEGAVSVIDTSDLTEIARIPVGAAPVQVGFTPDGARVYVSLRDEDSVAVIDTETREVIGKVPVGRKPIQVYATPDGTRVYVANQGTEADPEDTVSVIDVATNTVIETITTGDGAHGVVVSEDGSQVFVTNIADDTVSAIDEETRTVVATFNVGDGPNGITFRPAAGQAQGDAAEHDAHHPQPAGESAEAGQRGSEAQAKASTGESPAPMASQEGGSQVGAGPGVMGSGEAAPMMQNMMQGMMGGRNAPMGMMNGPQGMACPMMAAMMGGIGPGMLYGMPAAAGQRINEAAVRSNLERMLQWHGNPRLKLGTITADEDEIVGEIVTQDNSLVQKLAFDRRTGAVRQRD